MARKKTAGGRSRRPTATTQELRQLQQTVEKVNNRINSLDRSNKLGTYASRQLLDDISADKNLKLKRESNKRYRFRLNSPRNLTKPAIKLYQRMLNQFLESETSTPTGIENARRRTRENVKEGLGSLYDREVDDEDLEDFYDMLYDSDFKYFADKIKDSDVAAFVDEAKERNLSVDDFIGLLEQHIEVNKIKDVRDRAVRLYNKYVVNQ